MKQLLYVCSILILFSSCGDEEKPNFVYTSAETTNADKPTPANNVSLKSSTPNDNGSTRIDVGNLSPAELVKYARTLTGVPYLYGSADPAKGFDCSGFITYVFNHFNVAVPRQSAGFTNVEKRIDIKDAKTGDLILFTGTDSTIKIVGHMGILLVNPGRDIKFLHSTSGKEFGVTETPLNAYYQGRYMRTIRIFPQNDR